MVPAGATQTVRRFSQPDLADGFARRIVRPVFSKMSAADELLAGVWLKRLACVWLNATGPEIGEGRLVLISSSGKDAGGEPGSTTFTWRQMIEVNDVALDTAIVQGWFVAQAPVSAIRFNGKNLAGFVNGGRVGNGDGGFVIGSRLMQPVNTLEIDVSGATPSGPQPKNLMWLRLRVAGIRLPAQKGAAAATTGVLEQQQPGR
jgi:hypothetical protein